jgi:hypothetical protein
MNLTNLEFEKKFIDKLKNESKKKLSIIEKNRPSYKDVNKIVKDLVQGKTLTSTIKKINGSNNEQKKEYIINVIAKFGTWVTHSLDLSNTETSNKNKKSFNVIKIPKGYEPELNNGRDITRAISAIVSNNPGNEAIARFVDRTYRLRNPSISLNTLNSICCFSNQGRIFNISKVSDDPVFVQNIVLSYNLLYNGIKDAEKSLNKLTTLANDTSKNYKKIYTILLSVIWLKESSILRFLSHKDRNSTNKTIQSEFNFLLKILFAELNNINNIGQLNSGQIRRLAASKGISVDLVSRENETQIRSVLKNMGLGSDVDKLVPDALRAEEMDRLDDFWNIIQLRIDGDVSWSEQLEDLLN